MYIDETMENNNEAIEYWNEKEEIYGGEVEYRSFCRFLGRTGGDEQNLAGLLFRIGDNFIFEDFEKEGGMLGIIMKRKTAKFEKTILDISIKEISSVRKVSQKGAQMKLAGASGTVPTISPLIAFLGITIYEFAMNDGELYYFEIMGKTSVEEVTGLSF